MTQERSGVGATRNKGFRASRASIVLFLDDDILVERDTLNKIVESHRGNQRAVVFGSYPFVSHSSEALHRFASRLFDYG
ncbi:glycosyltransferase family A protein, partial [Acinetobacter baumannii]